MSASSKVISAVLNGNGASNDKKGITAFLLIAFGLAWLLWEIALQFGPSADKPLFQLAILPGAFAPAIACFVVRKWITREGFGDAGLRLNLRQWPYYLVGWSLPLLVVSAIVVLAAAPAPENHFFLPSGSSMGVRLLGTSNWVERLANVA